jgi:hypothetical protein
MKTKRVLPIILVLIMVTALVATFDGRATAALKVVTPVMVNMSVLPSLVVPAAPMAIYTVPAGLSFTFTSFALTNNAVFGGGADLTNITVQIRKTVAGVATVTPIITTGLVANTSFSLTLGMTLGAGDIIEVVNGSGGVGLFGGPVNILIVGSTF